MVVSPVRPRLAGVQAAAHEPILNVPAMTCIAETSRLHDAKSTARRQTPQLCERQLHKHRGRSRDCAITRLPGGELRTRMEVIVTVVQLPVSGTVNCANAPCHTAIVHLPAGTRRNRVRGDRRNVTEPAIRLVRTRPHA